VTTPPTDRRVPAAALGVAGVALLLAAALLAPGGAVGSLRTVVGCVAVLALPGWLVGRLADEEGDPITRGVGGVVVTLAVCAVCGFVAAELGLRVATAVFAVPLLVLVAVAAVLGSTGPRVTRAPLLPLGAAGVVGVAALVGAWGTHLALPAPPVEPAFSIEAATAVASTTDVVVTVTVTRVRTDAPQVLTAEADGAVSKTVVIPGASATTRVVVALPAGTASCPSRVTVRAENGAFLTPPVRCTTGSP
jgi:hypothetical protein